MLYTDRRDLPLSTTSDLAAKHYRQGVDLLLSLWPGAAEALDQAIDSDPCFALAHAARARLHAICAQPGQAVARIAEAELLVERVGDERERSHVAVLSLAIKGASAQALSAALVHLDRWPRDVLIFGLPLGAFGLFAFSGMANHDQARVDLCERYARHFAEDDWWFLTYRGWAHVENGSVRLGRHFAQRALEHRRENANGAHALAHALHESGASEEAQDLLADWLPDYDRSGVLHGHLAWHAALVALERGDVEHALRCYTRHVAPAVSQGTPINIVSDSASFLWRLQAYGHEVPSGLWAEAACFASPYFQQPGFAFADVHMALIAAATGDHESLERRAAVLARLGQDNRLPVGGVVAGVARALLAFAEQDYVSCIQGLEPALNEVIRIGGSGAQREVMEDTLIVSMMKAGQTEQATALLDRRLHRRPSRRDAHWHRLCTQGA